MSTFRTCTTPEKGWALYNHFLGNLLLQISREESEEDVEKKKRPDRAKDDAWMKLLGALCMIARQMEKRGHTDTVSKMREIIEMVTDKDLTDPVACTAVRKKYRELNPGQREFDDAIANLKSIKL